MVHIMAYPSQWRFPVIWSLQSYLTGIWNEMQSCKNGCYCLDHQCQKFLIHLSILRLMLAYIHMIFGKMSLISAPNELKMFAFKSHKHI